MSAHLLRTLRIAGHVAIVGWAAACGPPPLQLTQAVVSALGARDGYVFVVSPFNCLLGGNQIDALNAIGERKRRSGVIIASGGAAAEDSISAASVAALGIRMRTKRLAGTAIESELHRLGWQPPVVIAVRRGEIIGVLKGEDARRLDSWVAWIERQPTKPVASEVR